YGKKIDKTVFPVVQGGPLMHVIAAKVVSFKEVISPEFKAYRAQVIKNAHVLSEVLIDEVNRVVSGGTDNHLVLQDVYKLGLTGKVAESDLDEVGITTNKNTIPYDQEGPFITSRIRLDTAAVTTRGFKETEMVETAKVIAL